MTGNAGEARPPFEAARSAEERTDPTAVLIVQRVIPAYRRPFYDRLQASGQLRVTVTYGDTRRDSALFSLVAGSEFEAVRVRNYTVGQRLRLVWQTGLLRLVRRRSFDAIILEFNPRILSNLVLFVVARVAGYPVIWWGHGIYPWSNRIVRRIRLLLAHAADAVIVYSEEAGRRLEEAGLDGRRVFVALNTIDTDLIMERYGRSPSPRLNERRHFLYVGRLIEEKRVEILINAFEMMAADDVDRDLVIVGDGPCRRTLEDQARTLGLSERVRFLGAIHDEEELSGLFQEAIASVHPGYVGLGILHSFAYGVPAVVAAGEQHMPEIEAFREGHNGLLFSQGAPDALAACLRRLLQADGLWERLRSGAEETVRSHYNLDRMVAAFAAAVKTASTDKQRIRP